MAERSSIIDESIVKIDEMSIQFGNDASIVGALERLRERKQAEKVEIVAKKSRDESMLVGAVEREDMIKFFGEEMRGYLSGLCICQMNCGDCICCQIKNYRAKGLTAEQIRLLIGI